MSGGIKIPFHVKKGKQTLMIAERGFVCGEKWKRTRQERERRDELSADIKKGKQTFVVEGRRFVRGETCRLRTK